MGKSGVVQLDEVDLYLPWQIRYKDGVFHWYFINKLFPHEIVLWVSM